VAEALADVERVVPYGEAGFGLDPDPVAALSAAIAALLPCERIGVESDAQGLATATVSEAGAVPIAVPDLIREVRLVKDEDEQVYIAHSVQLALAAQSEVARGCLMGQREIDLYTAAFSTAQTKAGVPIEFGGDLLVGERTAKVCGPVVVPGDRRSQDGDVVVSDLSVRIDGYWGDTARTYIVGTHEAASEAREHLTRVLADAAAALRPGVACADIFAQMRAAILARYPDGEFPHHGGHGLGIAPLEDPHLVPADKTTLREGMVLAIEPGVYLPGRFGVRVEDVFAVTADGGVDIRERAGRS
jgi:Xaa-Pro aminopeptidase